MSLEFHPEPSNVRPGHRDPHAHAADQPFRYPLESEYAEPDWTRLPGYTEVTEAQAEERGLDAAELAEVRWFNENLTAFHEGQKISALVLSTALLAWNAQLVNLDLDRDALLTGLTLAWFASRLPTD